MANERNQSLLRNAGSNESAILGQGWQDAAHTAAARGEFSDSIAQNAAERSRWQDLAKNGMYTPQETEQMLASGSRNVEDKYNAAAANTLNAAGGRSVNPFGAAALVAKGATEGGKARADVFSAITKDQASSRIDAAKQLVGLLDNRAMIAKALADIDMHEMPGYAAELLQRAKDTEDRIAAIAPQYGAPSVPGLTPNYTAPPAAGGKPTGGKLPPVGGPPKPPIRPITWSHG
jgi:hypothetical protein